jgi:hypothetical protein
MGLAGIVTEAVGAAGPCAVSREWVVVCGVSWAAVPVVVSLPLGCGSGWPLLLWVEPCWVTRHVCGGWGGWAMCCVLGQAAAAVVDVWWVVGPVMVSTPLGRVLGWPLLLWVRDLRCGGSGGSVGAWWGRVNDALCAPPSCEVSPVVCSPPVAPCTPHIPRMRGKGSAGGGVSFVVFETCRAMKS